MEFYGTIKEDYTINKILPSIYKNNITEEFYVQCVKSGMVAGFNNIDTYTREVEQNLLDKLYKMSLPYKVLKKVGDEGLYILHLKILDDKPIAKLFEGRRAVSNFLINNNLDKSSENMVAFIENYAIDLIFETFIKNSLKIKIEYLNGKNKFISIEENKQEEVDLIVNDIYKQLNLI